MKTQERRTRLLPTSQETERRRRDWVSPSVKFSIDCTAEKERLISFYTKGRMEGGREEETDE